MSRGWRSASGSLHSFPGVASPYNVYDPVTDQGYSELVPEGPGFYSVLGPDADHYAQALDKEGYVMPVVSGGNSYSDLPGAHYSLAQEGPSYAVSRSNGQEYLCGRSASQGRVRMIACGEESAYALASDHYNMGSEGRYAHSIHAGSDYNDGTEYKALGQHTSGGAGRAYIDGRMPMHSVYDYADDAGFSATGATNSSLNGWNERATAKSQFSNFAGQHGRAPQTITTGGNRDADNLYDNRFGADSEVACEDEGRDPAGHILSVNHTYAFGDGRDYEGLYSRQSGYLEFDDA